MNVQRAPPATGQARALATRAATRISISAPRSRSIHRELMCGPLRNPQFAGHNVRNASSWVCTAASAEVDVTHEGEEDDEEDEGEDEPAPIKWYERPCPWKEVETIDVLNEVMKAGSAGGKLVVVDYYASWCSSCKAAFSMLCKMPKDKTLAANFEFYKANVASEDIRDYVKTAGITGIPRVVIYKPDGEILLDFSATQKKLPVIKAALAVVAANRDCARFIIDPQGTVVPDK